MLASTLGYPSLAGTCLGQLCWHRLGAPALVNYVGIGQVLVNCVGRTQACRDLVRGRQARHLWQRRRDHEVMRGTVLGDLTAPTLAAP